MMWQGRSELFVSGAWIPGSGEFLEVVSPTTEEQIARFPGGSPEDVDRAVRAARQAFDDGPWAETSLEERLALVAELRRLLEAEKETAAQIMTAEMGCPISQSRSLLAQAPLDVIDSYLDVARTFPFRAIRESVTARALVTHEPVGVVAAIVPWNSPLGISVQKVVPALIAACTVVLKPAPETALSGFFLASLVERAGFPAGVVNVIPADRAASETLVTHPGVDKVTFTGSTVAGRRIAALCGNDLKRVSLELGGKSAAVVLDDADLDSTVEALRMGAFRNSGQICTLKTRVLVSTQRERELVERLEDMVGWLAVGDPRDEATQIGPMVTSTHRERVEGYVASGTDQGAVLVTGGGRPASRTRGWYVDPTLFTKVTPDMKIAREEIFGPVLSVLTYEDEAQAVAIANDTPYGLSGAVFTADVDRGVRVAQRMRTGVVEVNGSPIGLSAPFGGFKASGIGRENGPEGLSSYLELRSIGLPRDPPRTT